MKKYNEIKKDILLNQINETTTTVDNVNGMGDVVIPDINGKLGSGDSLGGTAIIKQKPQKTISMKKFNNIKEERKIQEKEVYIPIKDIGDPAYLISILAKELTKRSKAKESEVSKELTNIELSYNGKVDINSIDILGGILDIETKPLKKHIDEIIDDNISLLESMQVELINKILNNPDSLNEGVLGRAIGGIAGYTLGKKVGKLIAKVLGIEKGPLFNLLTSRVVSAAMAQELTKNLL